MAGNKYTNAFNRALVKENKQQEWTAIESSEDVDEWIASFLKTLFDFYLMGLSDEEIVEAIREGQNDTRLFHLLPRMMQEIMNFYLYVVDETAKGNWFH